MKVNLRKVRHFIFYYATEKSLMEIEYRNGKRFIYNFEDNVIAESLLKELLTVLKENVNQSRLGFLFSRTSKYAILQIVDSDNDAEYTTANLFLKNKIQIDRLWEEDNNKNFSLIRLKAVAEKGRFEETQIYLNVS